MYFDFSLSPRKSSRRFRSHPYGFIQWQCLNFNRTLQVTSLVLNSDAAALEKIHWCIRKGLHKSIRKLCIIFCIDAIGDGSELVNSLASFEALESLAIDACTNLTSSNIAKIGSASYTSLSFYWTPNMDDRLDSFASLSFYLLILCHRAVASLVRSCPRLISLNLSGSRRLSDAAVDDIGVHCKSLEHLNLTKAVALTDASLYSLARSCPYLRTLNLYACPNVWTPSQSMTLYLLFCQFTDEGVIALSNTCRRLEDLDLCGSQFVSDYAIDALARNCPNLRRLNLTWCIKVSNIVLDNLSGRLNRIIFYS